MNKVNFEDDERLDVVDVDRMQDFVNDGVANGVGGILSIGSGSLTQIRFSGADETAVEIGPGQLYDATLLDNGDRAFGRVLVHDPTIPEQAVLSTIDFTPWLGQHPWIWARRALVDTDFEARRKWVILSASEETFNLDTITRELVEWHVGLAVPGGDPLGWFRVGYVQSIVAGPVTLSNPIVYWIHPFDATDGYDGSTGLATFGGVAALWELADVLYLSGGGVLGIGKCIKQLVTAVTKLRDSENPNSDWWYNPPALGMVQVQALIDALEAVQQTKETQGVQTIAAGLISESGGSYTVPDEFGAYPSIWGTTLTKLKVGHVQLTVPGKAFGVNVTVRPQVASVPPEVATVATAGAVTYDDVGNTSTFQVWLWDTDALALADRSFYVSVHGDPTP